MQLTVTYQAQFTTTVEVQDSTNEVEIRDACYDIDIPEGEGGQYKPDSFGILRVQGPKGKIIRID